tara:strand:+ start:5169 stop:6887 length:1719 start_codon:yes stop_codon:yes gene_type:complete
MQSLGVTPPIGPIEIPSPAGAVRLRRPVTLTVTYVVVFTAALVFLSLMPFSSSGGDGDGTSGVVQAQGGVNVNDRSSISYETPTATLDELKETNRLEQEVEEEEEETMEITENKIEESTDDASSSSPKCVFHLYRHLSKTGGTTVRFIFDRQTVFGDFEYPLPYGFDGGQWNGLLERWREAANEWQSGKRKAPPKTLVELRGNWPSNWGAENFEKVLGDVEGLREEYGGVTGEGDENVLVGANSQTKKCSVTTSLMFRDPKKQYKSFWRYYIEKKQEALTQEKEAEFNKQNKKWPDVDGRAFWGSGYLDWARNVPSMQIRELLGNKCTPQMRQPGYDATWDINENKFIQTGSHTWDAQACPYTVDDSDYGRFLALLDRFDVVGVTEKFDNFLLAVAEKVGLEKVEYVKSNVRSSDTGKQSEGKETAGEMTGGGEGSEDSVLEQAAHFDIKAHRAISLAQDEGEENLAGGRTEFQKRVQRFVNATEVSDGCVTYVGGVPTESPYVWVKTSDLKGLKSTVPPSFTDESGGGQAVAYIVFDPVSLVDRKEAEAKGISCIKGCTFDAPKSGGSLIS